MTTQYSVIQYLPDPALGERLNVGVVVWGQSKALFQFTNNWRRIRHLIKNDTDHVQSLAIEFGKLVRNWNNIDAHASEGSSFFEVHGNLWRRDWNSPFHLTEPRGSIKGELPTLEAISPLFLHLLTEGRVKRRTRSTAVSIATRALRSAVSTRLTAESGEQYVIMRPMVEGALEVHQMDVGLRNGALVAGVHAISFEGVEPRGLEKEVEATAWIMEDIRKLNSQIPLSVFTLPANKTTQHAYDRARMLFQKMSVPVVDESDLPRWAASQADRLAEHVE